jgi:cellulose synthase/poly-beta-1,6-N-acetylglucosamine synthase-like glycosyltransferase/PleD family two-component response regulator
VRELGARRCTTAAAPSPPSLARSRPAHGVPHALAGRTTLEEDLTAALETTTPAGSAGTVLLVEDDEAFIRAAQPALEAAGYVVTSSPSGEQAETTLADVRPDVVVADVATSDVDGFELLRGLRAQPAGASVPVILLTGSDDDVLTGLRLGADDCVAKPLSVKELVARVRAKTARPPVPADLLSRDLRTGLISESALVAEADRELVRGRRVNRPGALGVVHLQEMPRLVARFGPQARPQLAEQLADILRNHDDDSLPLARLGLDAEGQLLVLLPETASADAEHRLAVLAARVAATTFTLAGEHVRVTPVTGWVQFLEASNGQRLLDHARTAAQAAVSNLDLLPVAWTPALEHVVAAKQARKKPGFLSRLRLPAQVLATFVVGLGLPFLTYLTLGHFGIEIAGAAYWIVFASLLITAGSIWIEGLFAFDPKQPPAEPGADYPAASAIIAAYLPNEAETILDTVEAFRKVDYPGDLQILVAYNTPTPMSVEDELRELARRDPRVVPLKVEGSTSKAQNVNAAMSHVKGEFVGMFDADHHPDPTAFRRAWRWLSNGYDVVQGHCVIRNGHASLVARTVAVEFESIYAVSHPGRAALHGFGLFGGSNGFWRTDLLARTRMRGSMLTEDIDSTLRVLTAGAKIASDPALVSRELAPTTWGALWKQRARWAQGWFQVSRKHFVSTLRSPHLTLRQKAGMGFLLGWREIYPWLSLQMFPVLAYTAYRAGGVTQMDWAVPALLLATLFTLAVGPAQALLAYRLAAPELRREKKWFWTYLLVSSVFYTEWKNVCARVAQVKELLGEAQWNVTARS